MENNEIESRSKEEVILILKNHGLGVNRRRKMRDYEAAKSVIFQGAFIDCRIYGKQIGWICDFLKI